ncbi:5'-3' exoribonuclease 1-like [Liolophura sinensis]|uniref:5'-3' exoribonuclease 1-like n=1 Tax=Liolophura sinensis TaxID=3198878 RepID=UPI0031596485
MGVPKFYRWISERYPCLSEVVKEFQIPEFDSLYLDMNGIVHVCSHPEDDNPHFRITEEKIFTDVSHYIEFLFRMIKPRRCFFMAIDGVAPRAKMNQQRGRRFRSAREAEELEKKAREKGEILPSEKRFDSNCITPGTPFMARLQEYLKYFVVQKISSDPLWQSVQVILSGHETPGEGEHKIMDYIRYQKSQPGYDPNTRHCLYGLDADLMMLGLVSHEPHFCLLREEVRFGGKKDKNKRPATPEETTFHLLHLSLMREYIDFEFSSLKEPLSFDYDLERVIDDWVLMGFLVGNDFIPHLPHLHIHHDGLPLLWRTYMKVLPTIDGYLNQGGHLNLPRFEKFMKELSKYDVDTFSDQFQDLKWLEGKVGKDGRGKKGKGQKGKSNKQGQGQTSDGAGGSNQFGVLVNLADDDEDFSNLTKDPPKSAVADLIDLNSRPDTPDTDDGDTFDSEFKMHKANYYMTKMNYVDASREVLQEQARGYVLAIQWILLYYFEGVPSWSWFYPHHYAPYMSDVTDFADMKIEFELGQPFLPFQQLMAVLPAASKEILPLPYQDLMTNPNSPVVDFYPVDFTTDLNGKLQEWEAVVLIPFIDEKHLLKAMEPINAVLTDEEKARNRHGPHRLFEYSPEPLGEYPSPQPDSFPDIKVNRARCTDIPMFEFRVPSEKLYKGLPPGVRLDVYFPGFPTMKHISHKAQLKKAGVKVFQMNSRGENMVVSIIRDTEELATETVAADMLGCPCFAGWPHLFEAKIVEVSDGDMRFKLSEPQSSSKGKALKNVEIIHERLSESDSAIWSREAGFIKEQYYEKRGIEVGRTSILLKALPVMGRKYVCTNYGQVTLEKQWATWPVAFALQACVKNISVHDPSYTQFTSLEELYAPSTPVFMLGFPHYGCQGEVLDVDSKMDGRIRVSVTILQEPNLQKICDREQSLSMQYLPGFHLAQRIGVSSHLLSRITGSIFMARGSQDTHKEEDHKVNIGLNLKFNKRNEEVPGFTKKVENQWLYSNKALDAVSQYFRRFPQLFDFISRQERGGPDFYFEEDVFPSGSKDSLQKVSEFLKTLPCYDVKPMKAGAEIVDELMIKEIEKEVDRIKAVNKKKRKSVKMQVKPHLLFRPVFLHGGIIPDPEVTFMLFDRVVNIREGFSVPFGLRGTVVGIHHAQKEADTMYEVIFDSEFLGGITVRCSPGRGYRCASNCLINISHGERKERVKQIVQGSANWSSSRTDNKGSNSSLSYAMASGSRGEQAGNSYSSLKNGLASRQTGNQNSNNSIGREADFGSRSSAQFSSARVTTNQTSRKGTGQTQSNKAKGISSEFADMWKEIQASTEAKSSPKKSGVSLSQAARVLDGQYPEKQQRHGIPPQSTPKAEKDLLNRQFEEADKRQGVPPSDATSTSQSGAMTKIDIQSLFGKASSSAPDPNVSEFAAMMNSLEIAGAAQGLSDGSVANVKGSSEDGTGAGLVERQKSLIVDDTLGQRTSPVSPSSQQALSGHSYGRQLSVQELFAGAKQCASKAPASPTSSLLPASVVGEHTPEHQVQPIQDLASTARGDYPLEAQVRPIPDSAPAVREHPPPESAPKISSHPANSRQLVPPLPVVNQLLGMHPPGLAPTAIPPPALLHPTLPLPSVPPHSGPHQRVVRNPVMELLELCNSSGMGPPKYDYTSSQKGQIAAYVTLSTGQKFHGSVCSTREAASESAASMTLRQLEKMSFNMMMMGIPQPPGLQGPRWRPNLPFSPNSAFSPVQPRFGVPFLPPGQAQFTHPPPNFFQPHYLPQMPTGAGSDAGYHHGYSRQLKPADHVTSSGQQKEGERGTASNPFIPLQVIQKQKSPQKPMRSSQDRGEIPAYPTSSETTVPKSSLTTAAADGVPLPSVLTSSNSAQAASNSSLTVSNSTQAASNSAQRVPHTAAPASRASTHKSPAAHKEKTTAPQSDSGSKPQPKRTKSRLAAKFNFPN